MVLSPVVLARWHSPDGTQPSDIRPMVLARWYFAQWYLTSGTHLCRLIHSSQPRALLYVDCDCYYSDEYYVHVYILMYVA